MREVWSTVPAWPGYEVSDLGRIRSLRRAGPTMIMKQVVVRGGYRKLTIGSCNGRKLMSVHRLVLEAFVGPCPTGMAAAHENGDPSDNRLINLRWKTHKDNHADKLRHGTTARGERQHNAKLTAEKVREARRVYHAGMASQEQIASQFGVKQATISAVIRMETWRHVV